MRSEFHVKALSIFGSVARGKAKAKSDIDILVDFATDEIGLFDFIRLKYFLENILSTKVDLVTRDAIRTSMIERIEKELVRVA